MTLSNPVRPLNLFERYLTLWVALCRIAGLTLGKLPQKGESPGSPPTPPLAI